MFRKRSMFTFLGFMLLLLANTNSQALENWHFINHVMVLVSEENISGVNESIDRIGGIYTFGIISPITNLHKVRVTSWCCPWTRATSNMLPSNQGNIRYVTLWIPLILGAKVLHMILSHWSHTSKGFAGVYIRVDPPTLTTGWITN